MEKREKVLIALMVIALGYGAFELFVRPGASPPDTPAVSVSVDEAVKVSQTVSQSLAEAELRAEEKHILATAATPWTSNPFYDWPHARPSDTLAEEPEPTPELDQIRAATVYSGYLEMGRIRIAVINGLEYRVGETLVDGSFMVERITPASVTLMAAQSQQQIIIPYQDAAD
ncbi:MAG: hypothetical protein RBR20_12560 [Desulfobacterales bacterium]|jgi:hypothetical protein|nr:hypothetical protein [Desulfobacteraceae bacterium]MDD3993084.1 hypothetical protein [Desulfobacteraceae bacterium]MDY0312943.1 hypothetical protein [Desulfobacterales bacterium]